jgi:acetate---CoA ligase (ADP-forming)
MPFQITGERLASLFRPRSVALAGASDKSTFSMLACHNLVEFGWGAHTYLVSRRGTLDDDAAVTWKGAAR